MFFSLRSWLHATRPRTLPAALAPVFVGSAAAYASGAFVLPAALLCVLFALLMQVTSNFANDYFDFVNGVDTAARIGPVRAVASGQVRPAVMLFATLLVATAGLLVGLLLIGYGGWWLLPVGILSIVCAIIYTGGPFPLAYKGLGDVFAFLFFGPVAVGGTYYVQVGQLGALALLAGVGIGLLVANILVVNNYRDWASDAATGKRTLVVRLGRRFGWWQYVVSLLLAALVPLLLWLFCAASPWVLLASAIVFPGLKMAATLWKAGQGEFEPAFAGAGVAVTSEGPVLNRLLGKTALLALLYALLLGVGFLCG